MDWTDCITYISPQKLKEIDRTRMRAIGQDEVYSGVCDVLDVRNPTLVEDMITEIKRLRTYIESIDRVNRRETDILYRLMEERTLILSDVDEIHNHYC